MPTLARADLESLLRARKLDRTLTTTLPRLDPRDDQVAASGLAPLDARLGGGFPRGHLSELVGSASAGRTTIMMTTLAAATARSELVAIVDALDMFDVDSAAAAGIDLDRLLWIRGFVVPSPGLCHELNQRALEQAIKALSLVLQAGNFGVVVLDVAGAPAEALRRLPFTTWLRLQRMVEGTQTVCLLVGSEQMARSSAGLTVVTSPRLQVSSPKSPIPSRQSPVGSRGSLLASAPAASLLFKGLDIEARIVQARYASYEQRAASYGRPATRNQQPAANVRLHLQAAV